MTTNRILRMVLPAALALAALHARAEEAEHGGAGTVYPKAQYPYGELVKQPLTLSAGLIEIDVPVDVNLSKDQVAKPWNIPASADYGYTDDLQFGIFHSTGLCLAGQSNGCAKAYDDVGGRVRYGLVRDPGGQLALQAGVLVSSIANGDFEGLVGAAYKRTMGSVALVLEANLGVALNKREERAAREVFEGRAELQLQLMRGLAAFGHLAYQRAFEEAPGVDLGYLVPVGFGAEYELFPRFGVGAELTFENLLGKDSTADERTGTLFVRLFL